MNEAAIKKPSTPDYICFPSGKRWAKNEKAMNESLFDEYPDTAMGLFKKKSGGIMFEHLDGKPWFFLVCNRYREAFFVSIWQDDCGDGKIHYMQALSSTVEELLGLDKCKYSEGIACAVSVGREFGFDVR